MQARQRLHAHAFLMNTYNWHTHIYQSAVPVRLSSVWPTPLPCNWLHLLLKEPWLKEQGLHTYFCSARISNVCRQMDCTVRRPLSHILFMHAHQHLIHASARREQQRRRTHNIQTRTTQAIYRIHIGSKSVARQFDPLLLCSYLRRQSRWTLRWTRILVLLRQATTSGRSRMLSQSRTPA